MEIGYVNIDTYMYVYSIYVIIKALFLLSSSPETSISLPHNSSSSSSSSFTNYRKWMCKRRMERKGYEPIDMDDRHSISMGTIMEEGRYIPRKKVNSFETRQTPTNNPSFLGTSEDRLHVGLLLSTFSGVSPSPYVFSYI